MWLERLAPVRGRSVSLRLPPYLDQYYFSWYYFPMKVTVKGQVTIPKEFRDKHGISPGTEVEFLSVDDRLIVRPANRTDKKERFKSALRRLRGSGRGRHTTDEIMAMTRGED